MKAIDKTIKQSEPTVYQKYEEIDPRFSASSGEIVIRILFLALVFVFSVVLFAWWLV